MSGAQRIACLVLLFFLAAEAPARSAGLRDIHDGWLLQTRELVLLLGGKIVPEVADREGRNRAQVWASAGAMQMFAMPELPVASFGLGIRLGQPNSGWIVAGRWQRTGKDFFQADAQSFTLAWERGWQAGVLVERRAYSLMGEPIPAWTGVKIRFQLPPVPLGCMQLLGEVGFSVWELRDWRDHLARQRRFRLVISGESIGLSSALEQKATIGWALGLELAWTLSPEVGISVRADADTGAVGPGTFWLWGPMLLKTSHVVHPELGITHRIALTTGALGAVPW